MAYKVIILYRLYMPSYFVGTFTEYPLIIRLIFYNIRFKRGTACYPPFLKVLRKPEHTMNRQQTHAETSVGTDDAILVCS